MNDKELLMKGKLNPRETEISNLIDMLIPDNNIKHLILTYKSELEGYDYIDTLSWFSTLELKGSMRYINKYDKKIRYGGLLIKIYNKSGKWIAIIKQNTKKYYISFDKNYIFYNKANKLLDWANCFLTDIDKGVYDIK
jgi:hypothetical protein